MGCGSGAVWQLCTPALDSPMRSGKAQPWGFAVVAGNGDVADLGPLHHQLEARTWKHDSQGLLFQALRITASSELERGQTLMKIPFS